MLWVPSWVNILYDDGEKNLEALHSNDNFANFSVGRRIGQISYYG